MAGIKERNWANARHMLTKLPAKEITEEMKKQDAGGQAGAQIEVTRKMVDAGKAVLIDFEWGWVDHGEYAERIFRAMSAAASQGD